MSCCQRTFEVLPADSCLSSLIRLSPSAIDVGRNICHGSDSVDSAKKEIALWFGEQNPTVPYKLVTDSWVYE